jgi:LmbE family N-acetylglucosaminyl deacetylase
MPFINHPDHRAIGESALDAVFPMARDFLTFFEHTQKGLLPVQVNEILLFNSLKPDLYVDITDFLDQKLTTLALHKSQMNMEIASPVVKQFAENAGNQVNVEYAEAFHYIRLPSHVT